MAAPKGNKFAEKWTRELTLAKLSQLKEQSKKNDVYYIGQGLANLSLYHQWYSMMAEKFAEDEEVYDTIKEIDQAFEAKLVSSTLQGNLNPTMAIFTLKNKHLWKDKTEVDQNTNLIVNWPEEFTE